MFSLSFLIIFLVRSKSVRNRLDRYENCPLAANSKRQGSQLHIRGKHLHLYPSFASKPGVKVFISFPLTRRLLNKRTKHLTPVLGVLLSYLVLSEAVCIFLSLPLCFFVLLVSAQSFCYFRGISLHCGFTYGR